MSIKALFVRLKKEWECGLPEYSVTDRAKEFKSAHLKHIASDLDIKLRLRLYTEQGGVVERLFLELIELAQATTAPPALATTSTQAGSQSPTSSARSAIVIDPPSNVRTSPNGDVICSIKSRDTINIYGTDSRNSEWYSTDACGQGRIGLIHSSQIRF